MPSTRRVMPLAQESDRPYVALTSGARNLSRADLSALASRFRGRRGVIVCGPQDDPELAGPLAALASVLGFPILADPLSQVRCGPHDRGLVLDSYDGFLRGESTLAQLEPEIVLRFGAFPTSKVLQTFLERFPEARHVVIDSGDGWDDPTHHGAEFVHASEVATCEALVRLATERNGTPGRGDGSEWQARWRRLNEKARAAMAGHFAQQTELSEGKVFAELAELLPEGSTLYVGNSMPIRDLASFFPSSAKRLRFLANRGASGIDGVVSSAFGAAAAGTGGTVLAIGDISFYHDSNGLLAEKRHHLDLTIVLINNDGGGIFSFLAQAASTERETFELLFGTPHGLDFQPIVEAYGGRFVRANSWEDFRTFFRESGHGLRVIEVRTDRQRNVAAHTETWRALADALREGTPARASGSHADPR